MSGPLDGHPALDLANAAAAVVVNDRAVIGLDPLVLDAVVQAGRQGLAFQLLTPASSRLTLPLDQVLRETRSAWVVRTDHGVHVDAFTGLVLGWDGQHFVQAPGAPQVDARWADPPPAEVGSLVVDLTVEHRASRSLVLGAALETCCTVLADSPVLGWGVAEPVTQRWDREALSALAQQRAPEPTTLVVVGGSDQHPALGTLTVSRTTGAVRERLRLQVGGGTAPDLGRLDALAEALAGLAVPPRTALVGLQPWQHDGTVAWHRTGPTLPYGLLVGPTVLAEVGRPTFLSAPVPSARLLGDQESRSGWARVLPEGDGVEPTAALAGLFAHLGVPAQAVPGAPT